MKKLAFISILLISLSLHPEVKVDSFDFDGRMKFFNVPGLAITVVSNNSITWSNTYGNVDSSMLFQAASFSKAITALGVFKLIDQGLIDLDTDINSYIKDWELKENVITRNRKITLRQLLSHTSGIDESGPRGYLEEIPTLDELLQKINIRYYPGIKRRYSWSGFTIIQKIIQDVTGISYEEFITMEILNPLDMKESTFSTPSKFTKGNDLFGNEIEGGYRNYPELAASGLWSTPQDISKYIIEVQKIYNLEDYEGIVTKESVNQMLSYQKGGWGLGVSLKFDNDKLIFRHSGKNSGYTNYFISRVSAGEAIVIMTNGDNGWNLIMEILHWLDNYKDWGI